MDRWCQQRTLSRGAVLPLEQCWQLARRWYPGRDALEWRARSADEAQAIFADVGLSGSFWRLGHG